jgi:hypothetical protein
MLTGDLDEAERLATEAADIAGATGQADGLIVFYAQLFPIRHMQGKGDEIVDLAAAAAGQFPAVPAFARSWPRYIPTSDATTTPERR